MSFPTFSMILLSLYFHKCPFQKSCDLLFAYLDSKVNIHLLFELFIFYMSVPTPKIQVFSMITCQYSFFPMPYHYFIFIPKRSIGSYSHLHYMEIKSSLANSSRERCCKRKKETVKAVSKTDSGSNSIICSFSLPESGSFISFSGIPMC